MCLVSWPTFLGELFVLLILSDIESCNPNAYFPVLSSRVSVCQNACYIAQFVLDKWQPI